MRTRRSRTPTRPLPARRARRAARPAPTPPAAPTGGGPPVTSARELAAEYALRRWRAARLQAVPQAWCEPAPPPARPPEEAPTVPAWALGLGVLFVLASSVLAARGALAGVLP